MAEHIGLGYKVTQNRRVAHASDFFDIGLDKMLPYPLILLKQFWGWPHLVN